MTQNVNLKWPQLLEPGMLWLIFEDLSHFVSFNYSLIKKRKYRNKLTFALKQNVAQVVKLDLWQGCWTKHMFLKMQLCKKWIHFFVNCFIPSEMYTAIQNSTDKIKIKMFYPTDWKKKTAREASLPNSSLKFFE